MLARLRVMLMLSGMLSMSALVMGCGGTLPSPMGSSATIIQPQQVNVLGVALADAQDGWAVGAIRTGSFTTTALIMRLQHGNWQRTSFAMPGNKTSLNAVAMQSANEGWAVGANGDQALILHFTQGQWQQVTPPFGSALYALTLAPNGDGWAVGDGTVLRLHAGQWAAYPAPGATSWHAVAVDPGGTLWMAGENGMIAHLQGTHWMQTQGANVRMLTGLAFASPTLGWATGLHGTLLVDRNGTWTPLDTHHSWAVLAIALAGPNGGWIVGDGGLMLTLSNLAWQDAGCTTDNTLNALALTSATEGWAVGDDGTILHLHQGTWSMPIAVTLAPLQS